RVHWTRHPAAMTAGSDGLVPPGSGHRGSSASMATKESTPTTAAAQGSGPVKNASVTPPAQKGAAAAASAPAPRDPARDKAIDLALGAIEKQFGKGSIMRLGKDPIEREVQVIPTGSL